ncbi:MAG: S1C family serine protease, partial [Candidatus Thiodiazotropha taylori]|nr:S1C family serine protease [Candidatus Thiodiazotropha taylori]MCW4252277.1 S1C family serine protease [Candidatus Thiodiazotropha taylori]
MRDKKFQFIMLAAMAVALLTSFPLMARDLPNFADLAENNAPSVVNISTRTSSSRNQMSPFNMPELEGLPEGSPLGELMKKFFGNHGYQMPENDVEKRSLGSGFIISEDGYILT